MRIGKAFIVELMPETCCDAAIGSKNVLFI